MAFEGALRQNLELLPNAAGARGIAACDLCWLSETKASRWRPCGPTVHPAWRLVDDHTVRDIRNLWSNAPGHRRSLHFEAGYSWYHYGWRYQAGSRRHTQLLFCCNPRSLICGVEFVAD